MMKEKLEMLRFAFMKFDFLIIGKTRQFVGFFKKLMHKILDLFTFSILSVLFSFFVLFSASKSLLLIFLG